MNSVVSATSTQLETDDDEAAKLIAMADVAKTTLTIAAKRADSPTRKAEPTRIGERRSQKHAACSRMKTVAKIR